MKMKEIPKHTFMHSDNPENGHLFITHRGGNNYQTPYLILRERDEDGYVYRLLNLHSYQMNYSGKTIKELIAVYLLRAEGEGLNPVTYYFFSRRWNSEIKVDDTYGFTETGFKKTSPKQALELLKKAEKRD
jgi:hypothetical protein